MQIFKPVYFDKFVCTAGACPDTCCAGWQIMIDDNSLERYGEVEGSFGNRLRNSIDWMEGSFYQYDKRCAFLNEDNLCDLYSELGPDALCDTCRLYPRHVEEYEGVREWSLSLSCPVAARMLLSWQGEVEILEEETLEEEELDDFEDFDVMLYTQLVEARRLCFDKLWEDSFSADAYMEMCLEMAKEMQICVEEGEYFRLDDVICAYRDKQWDGAHSPVKYGERLALYEEIKSLERLRPEWDDVLSELYEHIYKNGGPAYEEIQRKYGKILEANTENVTKQLLFFFIYTYLCGGVYDDWIYSKMALCVESVRFLRELFLARLVKNGGALTLDDMVELSYRYAREIEHSDINLNEMEEYLQNVGL